MKRRYKVLPLPYSFQGGNEFRIKMRMRCLTDSKQLTPVFNRPGFYLDRQEKRTWVEFDGQAWEYLDPFQFRYDMEQSDGERWMDEHVYQALGVILDGGLGDKRLYKLHKIESDRRLLHRNKIKSRRINLDRIKRFKSFKEKHGIA